MANNTVRIDPVKVKNAANTISNQSRTMKKTLDDIKRIINDTKSYFKSDGGDEARRNFNQSAEKFDDFERFVKEYASFLESYAEKQNEVDRLVDEVGAKIPKL